MDWFVMMSWIDEIIAIVTVTAPNPAAAAAAPDIPVIVMTIVGGMALSTNVVHCVHLWSHHR